MKNTIDTKLVNLYDVVIPPKIPQEEYNAIYELFNSVKKNPKDFYQADNQGKIRIENNSVIYLDASDIKLNTLYPSIGNLKSLKELHLSYNQIKEIPKEIWELKNLRELYLSNNQITEIPKEIGELKNLQRLYLSYNQLSQKSKDFLEELKKKGVELWY